MYSNKIKSNLKRENIISSISNNLPKLAALSSSCGFAFLWLYLRNIDKLETFPQITYFSHGAFSIVFVSFILFFCINIPFLSLKFLFINNFDFYLFARKNKLLHILIGPVAILFFLSCLFYRSRSNIDYYGFIIILITLVFSILLVIYIERMISSNNERLIVIPVILYVVSFSSLILILLLAFEVSDDNDYVFFLLICIYLILLICGNAISFAKISLREYLSVVCMLFILFSIFPFTMANEFKLQRMLLKPIGIAQSPSQSGGYLLRNEDFLELIERNKFEKYVNTINKRTYTYIHGYLILNVGNVRVICPHDFEKEDNQKLNDQKLDFSRCLSFTSEDIKFMKRGFPKNYKKADLSKKANDSKKVNNSKKTENNKK